MLRQFLTSLFLFLALGLTAQFANPISWEFSFKPVAGDEFDLIAVSTAREDFAIYSQYTPEGGPIPTSFTWAPGDHYELVGKGKEAGHKKSGMDDMFGVEVIKFLGDKPVTWTQRVRVKDYARPIEVIVEWMCCDDEQCLPPTEEEHSYTLPPAKDPRGSTAPKAEPLPRTPASTRTQETAPPRPAPPSSSAPAAAPKNGTAAGSNAVASASDARSQNGTPNEVEAVPTLATYTVRGSAATENDPINWIFTAEKLSATDYLMKLTGTINQGWTIYGKDSYSEMADIATVFGIEAGEGVVPLGEVQEIANNAKVGYDKIWEAEVTKIGGTVTYSQRVSVSGNPVINGYIMYICCDHEKCLAPRDLPFSLDLSGTQPVAMFDGLTGTPPPPVATNEPTNFAPNDLGLSVAFQPEPVGDCSVGAGETAGKSLLTIFGLGLLGGLFAMLMPCIFPMIPLTVSFFTKSGGSRGEGIRKAGLYGFFIFLIYVLLSAPFHLLDGLDPGILNNIASSVTLNIIFFAVFIFFAGSFFGFYELTLPESWSNRASKAEGSGGIAGIFFMALTLALVSFSCTGPILGSLLVESVSGGAWPLTAGMAGFGVALGLPFALFAAFPGFLNNLPKSGGWLNSVKVVLGFVEVALAFKFLSTADLVGDWQFLRIEPFLAVWILCALGIAAYLLGFISFPLDSKKRKKSPIGVGIAVASLALAGYLAVGLTPDGDTGTYHGRKLMSGIAPPVCYNYLLPCDENKNITPFKDLEEGLAYARKVNKPVMLDFTGYSCVNCRKMEEHVWTEEKIKRYLTDEYVIVSLYVDERKPLPAAEHREVDRMDGTGRTRTINTVGKKWQYLQQSVYSKISQPYYVLVSPDGTTLNPPVAYTADVDIYEDFLECGLNTFRSLSK
jgi:thiol:disulfide interchange protein DsbD